MVIDIPFPASRSRRGCGRSGSWRKITGRSGAASKAPDAGTPKASQAEPDAARPTDTVELTESARSLQALESRLADVSEVDQQRVDEVRARIESGRYSVDAQRVADKMIALDRSLPDDR